MKITKELIEEMYRNKKIFHCDTKEKANELLQKAYDLGYKWCDNKGYLNNTCWTCYDIYCGGYGNIECYKDDGYEIIEYVLDKDCEFTKYDFVNNPAHYTDSKYECIEVMEEIFGIEEVKTFCKLNAFKYLWRANKKNGDQDLEKAKWYLCHRSKLLNGEEVDSGISPKDTLKMIKEISNYKNKEMK